MLFDLLKEEGYNTLVNFVYVPMNFKECVNFGYAFINLETTQDAENCRLKLQDFKRWPVPWEKGCEVSNGDGCQGVDEHVERYRNSPVMHESVPDAHRPALYREGSRLPFPAPTKVVKRPHVRARRKNEDQQPTESHDCPENGPEAPPPKP